MTRQVRVVEVGPRDGLQNESKPLSTSFKLELIQRLEMSQLPEVEVTSMVRADWVPQLSDADELLTRLQSKPSRGQRTVLVPNPRGLDRAVAGGARRIAVFIAASETFSQRNTNRSILKSLEQTAEVIRRAQDLGLSVRGYLSTAFVCPYEGDIDPSETARLTRGLLEFGCDQVSLGDTIGAAVPEDIEKLMRALEGVPLPRLALHLHNTYGTALANVVRGLDCGIRTFDSSVGGSGGCPYAPGASGNLATEDLLYLLERGGWEHGVDLNGVVEAARFLEQGLERDLPSCQLRLRQSSQAPTL